MVVKIKNNHKNFKTKKFKNLGPDETFVLNLHGCVYLRTSMHRKAISLNSGVSTKIDLERKVILTDLNCKVKYIRKEK